MKSRTVLDAYFETFNKHDAEAVAALFGRAGTYHDPATGSPLKGQALKDYLRAHFAAFPDGRYRIVKRLASRDGLIGVEWRFEGTHAGPLGSMPATQRAVTVPGASLLQAKGDRIAWLHGYYDRRAMFKQLGLA